MVEACWILSLAFLIENKDGICAVQAYRALADGKAQEYDRQMNKIVEELEKESEICCIPDVSIRPPFL